MKKVLLIGSGAREHAIGEKLVSSKGKVELSVFGNSKNPGLALLATKYYSGNFRDFSLLEKISAEEKYDFAIIGPENPIAEGFSDFLEDKGIPCVSPKKIVAQVEASKSFTRDLMEKYKIPGNPKYKKFLSDTTEEEIKKFLVELGENFVVKADGLEGGKGVKVGGEHLKNHEEALAFAMESIKKHGKAVIEEKLIGQEFSLMSFADGKSLAHMPPVQDHKRAFDGDFGPNTGGMGSYTNGEILPFLTQEDIKIAQEINCQMLKALFQETGVEYKGILYGGFMATKNGVKLIEYNCRFGDPESMNVLNLLQTDFVEICEAIIRGALHALAVKFENKASCCMYIVPEGYPEKPVKNEKIYIETLPDGVRMYFASVEKREDGNFYLLGSRAIAFVTIANQIEDARIKCLSALKNVRGPVFYRSDIGGKEILANKIAMMRNLR